MTLPHILDTTFTRPLEREFESWIVRDIEDYFLSIGRRVFVWAVSPFLESIWPADEVLLLSGKLIGLQFKQAQLKSGLLAFDRITWSLKDPPGQYELLSRRNEIFYALPTFINRIWARTSLSHCLFWRPPAGVIDYNAWHDNPTRVHPTSNSTRTQTRGDGGRSLRTFCTVPRGYASMSGFPRENTLPDCATPSASNAQCAGRTMICLPRQLLPRSCN